MGTTVRGRARVRPPTREGGPILNRNVNAGMRVGKFGGGGLGGVIGLEVGLG